MKNCVVKTVYICDGQVESVDVCVDNRVLCVEFGTLEQDFNCQNAIVTEQGTIESIRGEEQFNLVEFKSEGQITTKRFPYHRVCGYISNYFRYTSIEPEWKDNVISIVGTRRVGKTTLLQQLKKHFDDKALYIDCTGIKTDLDMSILLGMKSQRYSVILLDEICKLSDYSIATLVSHIKGKKGAMYVLTGSVSFVVEEIADRICDGRTIMLPPIMYSERLTWQKGVPLLDVFTHSSIDELHQYLMSPLVKLENRVKYIKGVVNDTLASYRASKFESLRNRLQAMFKDLSEQKVIHLLEYIALSQYIYMPSRNRKEYVDPQRVNNRLNIMAKQFRHDEIELFCEILVEARLMSPVHFIDDAIQNAKMSAYLFEYPQFIYTYAVDDEESRLIGQIMKDQWVESLIMQKMNYYYLSVGKYRSQTGSMEVDDVYFQSQSCGVVEVKNSVWKNVRPQVSKYLQLKEVAGIPVKSYAITNNTVSAYAYSLHGETVLVIRNDLLILLLELAWINSSDGEFLQQYTVLQLAEKYLPKSLWCQPEL